MHRVDQINFFRVRGRHRGLPVAVDRAVLLPSELVTQSNVPNIGNPPPPNAPGNLASTPTGTDGMMSELHNGGRSGYPPSLPRLVVDAWHATYNLGHAFDFTSFVFFFPSPWVLSARSNYILDFTRPGHSLHIYPPSKCRTLQSHIYSIYLDRVHFLLSLHTHSYSTDYLSHTLRIQTTHCIHLILLLYDNSHGYSFFFTYVSFQI